LAKELHKNTKYKPEYVDVINDLFDQENYVLSLDELSRRFKVNKSTIYNWRTQHPEFRQAMDAGKDYRNVEIVESELLKNCKDRWVTELKERFNKDGELTSKETRTRMIPGDVTAQKFYLVSRDPKYSKHLEEQGLAGGKSVEFNITIDKEQKAHGEDSQELHSGADSSKIPPVGRSGTRH
jgi:transposase-like protein